ncbi:TfoX/Sxy family protein [Tuwongella immobilis]|uniref:TfoX N-terminal domain-containing protein n=1 Tax=Tuwongella immobilis TaxID=692036 RepID=A0A6C2YH87_9BACT|nr:TfoX/Sxy family protein [Tuwongella immobilis]VIP00611.1 RNA methyltransferase TrmH, group 3 OS=Conexibacter woesei (strain DSM 14684 / JCM 11494 / NBRC 100937 / ID131577) GN=Cwoe_5135 PE=4 SV=1: TfoX_N [Tuwongella immobilis]VTR96640.1 RNA methyltransferase TrmH, group 3 OS=Conexibacter woesei (strain DSM 14684 / JCM 11494 / NBRC 100937 / ID131577) GN=Cwoe_5135 PE=4 SV=1: TfoX_N [Tuwongella immobilis]
MAASPRLAERIREMLAGRGIVEKRMFGGEAFFLNANILAAVWDERLVLRLGAEEAEIALRERHVRPFDLTGKAMRNWVVVDAAGIARDDELDYWLLRAWRFVETLPPPRPRRK